MTDFSRDTIEGQLNRKARALANIAECEARLARGDRGEVVSVGISAGQFCDVRSAERAIETNRRMLASAEEFLLRVCGEFPLSPAN